jgi:ABC-type branched-subunit amino acid transport system substrate-binding protein
MKKAIVLILAAAVIGFGAYKFNQSGKQASTGKPTINIGATLPLTGNLANVGISSQNSIRMALDKWKGKDTKYNYEVIFEDDGFEARKVAAITNQFVNINQVNAIFSIYSIGANVVSPISNKKGIIHMTCAYGSQPAEGFYNFNNITQYDETTERLLNELKKKGVKTIALLVSNNIGSTQQAEILARKIEEDGTIEIIGKELYNPGTRDFDLIIRKAMKNGEPDMFYIDGLAPEMNLAAKYILSITGKLNLTTINDFIETPDRKIFEGLWFVESAFGTDEFHQQYEEKYNDILFLCGANSYDNLDLLIWAYENTPLRDGEAIPNNEDVVNKLLTVKNRKGAIGDFFIDENGIMQSKSVVKVMKNNRAAAVD